MGWGNRQGSGLAFNEFPTTSRCRLAIHSVLPASFFDGGKGGRLEIVVSRWGRTPIYPDVHTAKKISFHKMPHFTFVVHFFSRPTPRWSWTWCRAWRTRSPSRRSFWRGCSGCGRTAECRSASRGPTSTSSTTRRNSEYFCSVQSKGIFEKKR